MSLILWKLFFLARLSKLYDTVSDNHKIVNLLKICPNKEVLCHVDRGGREGRILGDGGERREVTCVGPEQPNGAVDCCYGNAGQARSLRRHLSKCPQTLTEHVKSSPCSTNTSVTIHTHKHSYTPPL